MRTKAQTEQRNGTAHDIKFNTRLQIQCMEIVKLHEKKDNTEVQELDDVTKAKHKMVIESQWQKIQKIDEKLIMNEKIFNTKYYKTDVLRRVFI